MQEDNFVDDNNYINEKLYRYIGYTKQSDITRPKLVIPLKDNEDNLAMVTLLSEFRKKQKSFKNRCRGLRMYYEPIEPIPNVNQAKEAAESDRITVDDNSSSDAVCPDALGRSSALGGSGHVRVRKKF